VHFQGVIVRQNRERTLPSATSVKAIHHPAYRRLVERLVAARRRRHLSQADVARSMRVSRQLVSKVEICEVRLDVLSLIRFCRIYGISASDLVRRMEKELSDEGCSFFTIRVFTSVQMKFRLARRTASDLHALVLISWCVCDGLHLSQVEDHRVNIGPNECFRAAMFLLRDKMKESRKQIWAGLFGG
jgi:transcriptional regulator with XRE-family HTH domain